MDKPITVEEYQVAGEEFFPKYWYVAKELGEGAKTEDILNVMESLVSVVMVNRADEKKESSSGLIGFNKHVPVEDETPVATYHGVSVTECPPGTVYCNGECCDL